MVKDIGFRGRWDDILYSIAAVSTALYIIHNRVVMPVIRELKDFFRDIHTIKTLMEKEPVLSEMALAFRPNGGSSLPETVARIELKVDAVALQLESHDERLEGIEAQIVNGGSNAGEEDRIGSS